MRNYKIQIFFFLLLAVLFFTKPVKATTQIDLDYQNSSTATTSTAIAQSFIPGHDNFKAVKIASPDDISALSATLYLCSGILYQPTYSTHYNCTGPLNRLIASEILTPSCAFIGGLYRCTYTFTTPKAIVSGQQYYFSLKYSGSHSFTVWNGYNNGALGSDHNYVIPDDIAFTTYYDDTFVNFATYFWSIKVILPSPNWIYDSTQSNIIFKYTNLGGAFKEVGAIVEQLNAKNGTAVNDFSFYTDIASTTAPVIEGLPFNLNNGYYRLYKMFFVGDDPNINRLDSTIDFQVAGTSTNPFANASTSLPEILNQIEETICDDLDTGTLIGQMTCAFKRAALFVFKPSDSSVSSLLGNFMEFKKAFPFNAFFGLTDALQAGISTTTTETTFKVPFITATGTITTLPVMSSSTLSNFIGTTNNNLFRTSLVYFAWLIAGLMVYFTVRKI